MGEKQIIVYKVGEKMTTNDLYDNLAKQETMVKMTESLNTNNSCLPLTSGDGLNERSPE